MFDDILINPRTAKLLKAYLANPSQALLLSGPSGAGKQMTARLIASRLLGVDVNKLDEYPYYITVDLPNGKQEIPIEAVREISKALKLRIPGDNPVRRVVFINRVHLMNHQAQNAFLKSLEEPAPATTFILATNSLSSLLATITSRTAVVDIDPIALEQALKYFMTQPETEVRAAWALSQGMPGLLISLMNDENNELRDSVEAAKAFLKKTPYERLVELDTIKDKSDLAKLLEGLTRVLKALYRSAADRHDKGLIDKLTAAVQVTTEAQSNLELNVLPRLVSMSLVLRLPV